jgi:hypothetical protein
MPKPLKIIREIHMPRITQDRIDNARNFIEQYEKLPAPATDLTGWIALKFSCSQLAADRLITATRQNVPTNELRKED